MYPPSLAPWALLALGLMPARTLAADTLSTDGVSTCLDGSDIEVQKLNITYTRSTRQLVFDVAGTNEKEQNVTASLTVTAYGNEIYNKDFDPCSSDNYIEQLCPGMYLQSLIYRSSPPNTSHPLQFLPATSQRQDPRKFPNRSLARSPQSPLPFPISMDRQSSS